MTPYQDNVEGQCRENDTTLVVCDHDLVLEDMSLEHERDEREEVQDTMLAASQTYEGSFTVEFEDENDAREFWEWLHQ